MCCYTLSALVRGLPNPPDTPLVSGRSGFANSAEEEAS
jgi:hypothetical protein